MSAKKYLFIILIVSGIIGVIFFFPVNLNDKYTCLYHRMFFENHGGEHLQHNAIAADHGMNSLLQHYIGHYALLWWASIAVFTISIILLKKRMFITNRRSK